MHYHTPLFSKNSYGTRFQADTMQANKLTVEQKVLAKDSSQKAQRRFKEIDKELMQLENAIAKNPV